MKQSNRKKELDEILNIKPLKELKPKKLLKWTCMTPEVNKIKKIEE